MSAPPPDPPPPAPPPDGLAPLEDEPATPPRPPGPLPPGGLAPPEDGQSFESLEDLVLRVNEHAGRQGYAVVLGRTKKSKLKVTRKAWLICDRGRKTDGPRGQDRRHTGSRRIECPFSCVATRENDSGIWFLEVVKSTHNHASTLAGAHPALRKLAMTKEVKSEISRALIVQTAPFKILSSLRVADPTTGINFDDPENPYIINPLFKPRDIYNVKAQLRRETLGPLTPVQALIRELDQGDWTYQMQKDDLDRITHLFFIKGCSQRLLKTNYEVLVMDATYKTNRYKMPLLIISGQTALHTNFYVAFCFMAKEATSDYTWMLQQLRGMYDGMMLPNPIVIVTDMEKSLIAGIEDVFPATNHLLCLWHINNNVLTNCKKSFDTKEAWDSFFADWKTVVYASSEPEFLESWERFRIQYQGQDQCVEYLNDIYIPFRHRFVKCYTSMITHFETTTTSRGEGGHAVLKRQLGSSSGDLKTVVDGINLLLINELHNHLIRLDEAKVRLPMDIRKPIFQEISPYVTSYALRKIMPQYERLVGQPTAIPACTGTFSLTMGLPCSHKIQERLYGDGGGKLLLEDIHPHWRFDRTARVAIDNPYLRVQAPEVARPRGRPPGAENLNRRQQAFEASTNRDPSLFERVDPDADQSAVHRADPAPGRGRGRRGRGSGWGRGRGGRARGGVITRGLADKLTTNDSEAGTATGGGGDSDSKRR